jgi:hypothetical protein
LETFSDEQQQLWAEHWHLVKPELFNGMNSGANDGMQQNEFLLLSALQHKP